MGPIKSVTLAALWAVGAWPAAAQDCQLCTTQAAPAVKPVKPLQIDIETMLDFSSAAHTEQGRGSVTVDPGSGARSFAGLVGFGGPALRGTVTITGEPFRRIEIEMPATIRLNSTMGAKADVSDIRTNLSGNAVLGADGRLVFWFGGKLTVLDDAAGDFHGRIQINADYQ